MMNSYQSMTAKYVGASDNILRIVSVADKLSETHDDYDNYISIILISK